MSKSIIGWYGGKALMAGPIINLFPRHVTYVEVFGGGGHILLNKKKSKVEIYNDLNSSLVNLFKVLRNEEKAHKLYDMLQLTPYSKEEFEFCKRNMNREEGDFVRHTESDEYRLIHPGDDDYEELTDIEKARMFFTVNMQSFSASMSSWVFSSEKGKAGRLKRWIGKIDDSLLGVADRLREVIIENCDYAKILDKYDGADTLFYMDPPYIHDTRGKSATNVYAHEMHDEMHYEMVEQLLKVKGKVIVSGYDHPIYDPISENGWAKVTLGKYSKPCMMTGKGETKDKAVETLWVNFNIKNGMRLKSNEKGGELIDDASEGN